MNEAQTEYKRFRIVVSGDPMDSHRYELYEYHKSKDAAIEAHKHNVILVEEVSG